MSQSIETASPRKIAAATGVALATAVLVLLTAVLPAEYGIDPLGAGRVLGLVALAEASPGVIAPQASEFKRDAIEFVLGAYEAVEYKYRIDRGGSMLFSWRATGTVRYDFHSEPDGAPAGYAESFDQQESRDGHGAFDAPFPGIHGWYWENLGGEEVTIRLITAGFYSEAREFFAGRVFSRELQDARGGIGAAH
jgi:hypothetical protein